MEHTYEKILGKPNDYKQCVFCERLNWYENEKCIKCNEDIKPGHYNNVMTDRSMISFIVEEKIFWMEKEGYDEDEFWQIKLEV